MTTPANLAAAIRAIDESPGRADRLEAIRQLEARCYVALAEVDYDLRAWGDELYVRSVIDGRGCLSDFEEHTTQGFDLLDRALGRAS